MAIMKCKMCGADLPANIENNVVECEYCGSRQTVPTADNEKKMNLFTRANRLRFACEFDKASGIYESILTDFPDEAEAYWGLVLCRYGIEYVDDPATGRKIPTCHRSSFDSVLEDENFEQACENADAVARKVYRDEAKVIENLRKDIIEVSGKEAPYDIFICYKETDEHGDRTLDSVLAQDIYDALTAKGYRVFFSRITLEDKLGTQYEPYIFAALNSAKVMLAVGTDYEYYNAVWVKNEWSRYLQLMSAGQKKYLIPCYKNLDAYDMPKEFAKLQAQDLGKVGAMQDLLRGIEKLLGGKKEEAKPQQTVVQTIVQQASPSDALTERGYMFIEDGNFEEAEKYFERALDSNPKDARSYFGKVLVSQKCKTADALKQDITGNRDYQRAIQFANETDKKKYTAIAERILKDVRDAWERARTAKEKAEAERKAAEEKAAAERKAREERNRQLCAQMPQLLKEYGEYNAKRNEMLKQAESIDTTMQQESPNAKAIREKLEAANAKLAQLKRGRDTAERTLSGLGLFHGREKKELQARIESLSSNIYSTENEARSLEGDYKKQKKKDVDIEMPPLSMKEFAERNGKQDIYIAIAQFAVGNTVTFGSYAGEDIEWRVLEASGDKRIMISVNGLDAVKFNKSMSDGNNWKMSYVRDWLNGTFYNAAFTTEEQAQLTEGVTGDKVYLLSVDEAEAYFKNDDDRICKPTQHAKDNGADVDSDTGGCWWWLRSPGSSSRSAAFVRTVGRVGACGYNVDFGDGCVRPVVSLRLS